MSRGQAADVANCLCLCPDAAACDPPLQGWRLEIKSLPRLTSVGAWRKPIGPSDDESEGDAGAGAGGDYEAPDGAPKAGRRGRQEGGYYSQEEVRGVCCAHLRTRRQADGPLPVRAGVRKHVCVCERGRGA